mmetsp:Transcript_532/g.1949  ORF Transcript_532/g.1949 Transcript_532/m.1949 type:complete len:229 (-) Transcript_532:19-705(-)
MTARSSRVLVNEAADVTSCSVPSESVAVSDTIACSCSPEQSRALSSSKTMERLPGYSGYGCTFTARDVPPSRDTIVTTPEPVRSGEIVMVAKVAVTTTSPKPVAPSSAVSPVPWSSEKTVARSPPLVIASSNRESSVKSREEPSAYLTVTLKYVEDGFEIGSAAAGSLERASVDPDRKLNSTAVGVERNVLMEPKPLAMVAPVHGSTHSAKSAPSSLKATALTGTSPR